MSPSITIIIPAYNVEKYIKTAIKSVLTQTVKFDEVIIIDDGSTDKTLEVIESIEYDISVKIISQKNCGQGTARNKGIEFSNCDYLYFFDSDDLLEENACDTMKRELKQYNLPDIFLFEGTTFFDSGIENEQFKPNYSRPFLGYFKDQNSFFSAINRTKDLSCSPCLYISKRRLWQNNMLQFNHYYHEDEELFYRLLLSAKNYLVEDRKLFNRRVRLASTMTMSKNLKHVKGQIANLRTLHKLLNSYQDRKILRKAIRKRMYRFTSAYYSTCLQANTRADWSLIIKSFFKLRNVLLVPRLAFLTLRSVFPKLTYLNSLKKSSNRS